MLPIQNKSSTKMPNVKLTSILLLSTWWPITKIALIFSKRYSKKIPKKE